MNDGESLAEKVKYSLFRFLIGRFVSTVAAINFDELEFQSLIGRFVRIGRAIYDLVTEFQSLIGRFALRPAFLRAVVPQFYHPQHPNAILPHTITPRQFLDRASSLYLYSLHLVLVPRWLYLHDSRGMPAPLPRVGGRRKKLYILPIFAALYLED